MTRNLKALGLALVAALVLGALGAQGAAAAESHSFKSDADNEITVLTGQNEGNHIFRAGTGGAATTCTVATFSGTQAIGNNLNTVTVHPKYDSCTFGVGVTVTTGGCNYMLASDTTANPHFGGEYAAMSVECESTHDIKIDAACVLTFTGNTSNQSLHGVRYTNLSSAQSHSSNSAVTLSARVGQIQYHTIGGLACNAIGKPEGTYTDGIYEGSVSMTGFKDNPSVPAMGSTTNGTTWTHSSQVNIAVS